MALCWMLVAVIPSSAAAQAPANAQNSTNVPQSADGLKSQLEAILEAAKDRHSKRLDELISNLRVPDKENWFSSTFGDDSGPKLAAEYESSWEGYQDSLTNMFRDAATKKAHKVSVTMFSLSSVPPNDRLFRSVLQNAKDGLVMYTATARSKRGTETLPGIYVYVEGSFRVLNWKTLYDLPNLKPVRVRIGGDVLQAKLIHQVNPIPPSEAFGKHLQGTVVLHIIVDVDGTVKQVDVVSGPPELAPSAANAVRQWRYEPTLLNGDPVEVDSTVTVNFSLGW